MYISGTYWPLEASACQHTPGEYQGSLNRANKATERFIQNCTRFSRELHNTSGWGYESEGQRGEE